MMCVCELNRKKKENKKKKKKQKIAHISRREFSASVNETLDFIWKQLRTSWRPSRRNLIHVMHVDVEKNKNVYLCIYMYICTIFIA